MKRAIRNLSTLLLILLCFPGPIKAETARVLEVFDGDTVRIRLEGGGEETIRYLLIDTPELHHPKRGEEELGKKAAVINRALVLGKRVRIETDALTRDRYGRMLAYVWIPAEEEWLLVSKLLVESGYALPFVLPPNVKYAPRIRRACRKARINGKGLWKRAASRILTPSQAWHDLVSLRGHFITLQMKVASVKRSGSRWLIMSEEKGLALILYDSDQPLFGNPRNLENRRIRVVGKLRAGYCRAELYLRDPSQIRISTE